MLTTVFAATEPGNGVLSFHTAIVMSCWVSQIQLAMLRQAASAARASKEQGAALAVGTRHWSMRSSAERLRRTSSASWHSAAG